MIVASDVIRDTKLAGLLPCTVLLKDDRCAAVQPFTATVDPVAVVPSSRTSASGSSRLFESLFQRSH